MVSAFQCSIPLNGAQLILIEFKKKFTEKVKTQGQKHDFKNFC